VVTTASPAKRGRARPTAHTGIGSPLPHHRRVVPRTVRTTEALKQLVADYLDFDEFAFDVETAGTRNVRMMRLPGPLPQGSSRNSRISVCPACGRNFNDARRKWCSDVCSKAATKDKPALDARTNQVWCLSLAGPSRSDVIPMGHPDSRRQLWAEDVFDALEPLFFSDRRKVNQNVSFDLLSISKYYDDEVPPPPYGDTMILAFLLNENLGHYNLGELSKRYVGHVYAEKLGEEAYRVEWERAMRYSIKDAKMAWIIWWKLYDRVRGHPKLLALFDLEMDVLAVLMAMRQTGAYVDLEEFRRLRPELERQRDQAEQTAKDLIGGEWPDAEEINLRSTQKLASYFYDVKKLRCPRVTDKGSRSVDAASLGELARRSPVARAVLDYREVLKLESTYISGYIPHIEEDSRIRASFNQAVAKTGRLSCSAPNLQNIPARHKETFEATMVRRLFIAPPGKKLIVADYSQIELRILAHQTRDPKLLYAYTHDLDLHTQTASLIWRIPQHEVTAEQRAIAKNSNFNFAFEGGPMRVVQMSGIPLREAEKVYDAWHRAYPGVQKWGNWVKRFCWDHGYVETLYGRKRRLPEIKSGDWGERGYAERQAVNHPIQGSAADIAKIAIVRVHQALQGFDAHLVLQVHDEFVIECPERQVDTVLPLVRTAMEGVELNGKPVLSVPLEANISVGNNWAECK
jgi:DNA polymerase I